MEILILILFCVFQYTNYAQTTRYESESAVLTNAISETWRMTNPSGGSYAYVGNVSGASMAFTVNATS